MQKPENIGGNSLTSGKIGQKKIAYIYSLHKPITLPMHLLKEVSFYINCAK